MSQINENPEVNGFFPIPVARYNYPDELNDIEIQRINKELDIGFYAFDISK